MNKKKALYNNDSERIALVKDIFSSITPRYDFLNSLLSLRREQAWRSRTVRAMRFGQTHRFLDVATGTADLAIEAASQHKDITITGIDFVPRMVELGRIKVERAGLTGRISLMEGDACSLPFADQSFDVAAIAFGIRNIPDSLCALKQMQRVVVPGGQVMVLELTNPPSPMLRKLYALYLNRILPRIGSLISRDTRAYHYLAHSINQFPPPAEFASLLERAGLVDVKCIPLTFGVTHLMVGTRPIS